MRDLHIIEPCAVARARHRPYWVRLSRNGTLAYATKSGEITVLDASLQELTHRRLDIEPSDLAVADGPGTVAMAGARGLWILDDAGNFRRLFETPCLAAQYSRNGALLWVISTALAGAGTLEARDAESGEILATTLLVDPFGGSTWLLSPHPSETGICIWVAAGQDGQISYLARLDGREIVADKLGQEDTVPPVFSPDGRRYLLVDRDTILECDTASMTPIHKMNWPFDQDDFDEEDYSMGGSVTYLSDKRGTFNTGYARWFIFDTAPMRLVYEVALKGHEPRVISGMYPEGEPRSDLGAVIDGGGEYLLAVNNSELLLTRRHDWIRK